MGFGRIGKRLAEICHDGLHMPVYYYDPYVDSGTSENLLISKANYGLYRML